MKKKPLVKKAVKAAAPKKTEAPDTFEIEASPPLPYRSCSLELQEVYEKLDRTVSHLKKNQAFIIPQKRAHSIKKYLAVNYPEKTFKLWKIKDSDNARIYLLN